MDTFAYCAKSFEPSARRAGGCHPVTCPPVTAATFRPAWLEGREFVYLDLHGAIGDPVWYGDEGIVALRADQLLGLDLQGAVVFAATCYAPETPVLDALLQAGAVVIAGAGINYAGYKRLMSASLLGLWIRMFLQIGLGPEESLRFARRRLGLSVVLGSQGETDADALAFRIYRSPSQVGDRR